MSARPFVLVVLLVVSVTLVVATPEEAAAICFSSAAEESSGSDPVEVRCPSDDRERVAEARASHVINGQRPLGGARDGTVVDDVDTARSLHGWTDVLVTARWWAHRYFFEEPTPDPELASHLGHHSALGQLVGWVRLPARADDLTERQLVESVDAVLDDWWATDADRATWMDQRWHHFAVGASIQSRETCDETCVEHDWLTVVAQFRRADGTPPTTWHRFPVDGGLPPRWSYQPPTFDDVPDDHVFSRPIQRLADADVTRGCGGFDFCPAGHVTREQMAAFLVRALDLPPGDVRFTDVPSDHTFVNDIAALAEEGITRGCTADGARYCPGRAVTRAEMAAFLVRALDLPAGSSTFRDVPAGHEFRADIAALADAGITRGCDREGTLFCPDAPVTRAQMAAFLARSGVLDPGWGY